MRRTLASLVALALLGGACSGGSADTTTTVAATTTSVIATTTITTTPTTVTTVPPTTTTQTVPTVAIDYVDTGRGLMDGTDAFYQWLADPTSAIPPVMPPMLLAALIGHRLDGDLVATARSSIARAPELGRIAVVEVDDDSLIFVQDGLEGEEGPWRIVGGDIGRFDTGPVFGEPVRMVMIIGTDARPGYIEPAFRADSLHLLTASTDARAGAVVGFPRDTYVVASYGTDKITNVNALAGTDELVDILREMTGLPIEGYILTGFDSFTKLVDRFGGVFVDVPFAMNEPKAQAYLSAGPQTLDGADALGFSRNRTLNGGDFTRSFHQGVVILGAMQGALDRGLLELPGMVRILSNTTFTDLSLEDLVTLAATAFAIDPDAVENIVLQGIVTTRAGASVVVLNEADADAVFEDLADGVLTVDD